MSDRIESVDNDDADSSDLESKDWEQDEFSDDQESESPLEDWGGGELEAAYLKALSALEASESEMPHDTDEGGKPPRIPGLDDELVNRERSALTMPAQHEESSTELDSLSEDALATNMSEPEVVVEELPPVVEARPTPRQIIEACLFVGGNPLTSNRISVVLRGEFDADFVDREINELNRLYAVEERPYEIRLGEGGYRLALREG